ncbi:Uncharacterised protein [Vibrio cholerae]|nr:Uncharacterised protein [Vibrio cholerae]
MVSSLAYYPEQAQPLPLSWLTVWSVILPRKIRKKSSVKVRFVA